MFVRLSLMHCVGLLRVDYHFWLSTTVRLYQEFHLRSNLTTSYKIPMTPGVYAVCKMRKIDVEGVCPEYTNLWEIPAKNVGFEYTRPCI